MTVICADVFVGALRSLAWSGIPDEVRPIAWQLLLVGDAQDQSRQLLTVQNYLPSPVQPRLATLNRKRKEYSQLVEQYFGRGLSSLDQQVSETSLNRVLSLKSADLASNRDRCASDKTWRPAVAVHDNPTSAAPDVACAITKC